MDIEVANEIIACLPKDRTVFDYYKDRYAVMLLERLVGEGRPIADIKQTRFAKLLGRPVVKDVVAVKGDGLLSRSDLIYVTPKDDMEHYVLTLGVWGGSGCSLWDQTSRKGVNLVLQLNFSREHDRPYRRLISPRGRGPFVYAAHPVCKTGRNTLAWARIDLDLAADEALVEEVQNDWLREADWHVGQARPALQAAAKDGADSTEIMVQGIRAVDLVDYVEGRLNQHKRIWSEAMLAAAIWFLTEEIGIRTIWYHDAATGAQIKQIKYIKPPRSLYTDLPKRFCFERTSAVPGFIGHDAPRKVRRAIRRGDVRFWRHEL